MSYYRKWKPSKAQKEFFKDEMQRIETFCNENNIRHSLSKDSYYFHLNGTYYRVSNHTMDASNRGAYNEFGEQIREHYHTKEDYENTVCIFASKTRIIQIYNDLKAGHKLDGRGRRISEKERK